MQVRLVILSSELVFSLVGIVCELHTYHEEAIPLRYCNGGNAMIVALLHGELFRKRDGEFRL
jgi:hypothetical protein